MHPNNIHNKGYDFSILRKSYTYISPFVIKKFGKSTIDFSDSKAVIMLNKALLKTYYNINFWEFSSDNLCPPIPSRVDYIHYLADLIDSKSSSRILDIGTGATCVYPLIGNAVYGWDFVGSDINKKSLTNANLICDKNKLSDKIEFRLQENSRNILKEIIRNNDNFDAVMCNPPFFKSKEEAQKSNLRKLKGIKANANNVKRNFGGISNELWCKGGEKAFLIAYINESFLYKKQCKWFTSLVSKKENIRVMYSSLRKLKPKKIEVIEMDYGNKKSRIVAWRF